ncbi:MAG TPA: carboxypeptidase-like regulatory domain-containing protein [Acidobacteriaceae bacterium]|nr:carboxypeptidase-like regulatory domain-containing protein [Acidobacteriaceae bacterium]
MTARSGLLAQGIITGSITGTVGDPTGAVVPGADVVLSNPATGIQYKSKTKADGTFNVDNLPVGKYTVMISGAGFSALTLQNVEVDANRTQALGLEKLQTGNASETVEVSAASNLLETTESQVTTTFQ